MHYAGRESGQLATLSWPPVPMLMIGLSLVQPCHIQKLVSSDSLSHYHLWSMIIAASLILVVIKLRVFANGRGKTHIHAQCKEA